jgi:hypothetical protein
MGRPWQIPWQDDEATLFHWYRNEKLPDLRPRLQPLWLACGVTIWEMARRLGRSPCKILNYQILLEVFTAHIMKGVRIDP